MDVCNSTIAVQAKRLRSGETSSEDLTRLQLERIERYNPKLGAYITVTGERALADAARADEELRSGKDRGPLHGIPIAIKDLVDTAGIRTTCGSAVLAENVPDANGGVAARLAAAGSVLVGKLTMTEFALSGYHPDFQVPVNPWDPSRWTGVSSSGSGVATAAGLCFGAIGTDTGGSIRFPAACNGVVGLKPTYGRVTRQGVFPLAASLDHVGPLTRCVHDAAAMFDAISGLDPADPTTLPLGPATTTSSLSRSVSGLRLGVDREFIRVDTDPQIVDAVEKALTDLQGCGVEIVDVKMPSVAASADAWYPLCSADALDGHRALLDAGASDYGPTFRSLLDFGSALSAEQYAHAHAARLKFAGAFRSVLAEVDAIACPSTPLLPPPIEFLPPDAVVDTSMNLVLRYTAPFDMSGSPTLSLPCGLAADGMPISLQLVGRHCEEDLLLRLGHTYECATDWHLANPDLSWIESS